MRRGESQYWAIGAILALAAHGVVLAVLIGGRASSAQASPAIAIDVELGAEAEVVREQRDVVPGEARQEAARPQPQRTRPSLEAPHASNAEFAALEPVLETREAPAAELAAAETTAPQTTESQAARPYVQTATYEQILLAHLERNKRYPRAARTNRQQGLAYVRFRMNRQGRVLSAELARSSGHDLLDEEVIALVRRAQPLPPPPPSIAGEVIDLTVPVEFYLR